MAEQRSTKPKKRTSAQSESEAAQQRSSAAEDTSHSMSQTVLITRCPTLGCGKLVSYRKGTGRRICRFCGESFSVNSLHNDPPPTSNIDTEQTQETSSDMGRLTPMDGAATSSSLGAAATALSISSSVAAASASSPFSSSPRAGTSAFFSSSSGAATTPSSSRRAFASAPSSPSRGATTTASSPWRGTATTAFSSLRAAASASSSFSRGAIRRLDPNASASSPAGGTSTTSAQSQPITARPEAGSFPAVTPQDHSNLMEAIKANLTKGRKHIFISYARAESFDKVAKIAEVLSNAGLPVWRDQGLIPYGDILWRILLEAIEASIICIVVHSSAYLESEWCPKEYKKIRELKRSVFPVLTHAPSDPTKKETYEKWLKEERVLKTFCFHVDAVENETEMQRLVKDVTKMLNDELTRMTIDPLTSGLHLSQWTRTMVDCWWYRRSLPEMYSYSSVF